MTEARGEHRLDLDADTIAAVLDILPDPAIVFDEEMRCVAVNKRTIEVTGRTAAELDSDAVSMLVHPDDLPLVASSFEEVLAKEVGTAIEIRIRAADGGWRLAEVVGSTFHHGRGVWQIDTFRDLTARRQYEVASADTERFRVIVESSALVVLLCDADGTIESVSGAMCRQLGHDPTRVIGTRLGDWVAASDRVVFDHNFADAVAKPGVHVLEVRLRHTGETVKELLNDPERRAKLAKLGREVILSRQGATNRHADMLLKLLEVEQP
ncbi:MAG: PAS domain S-box protein [Acidimicrobiales bacterium]|nr:PAS domain S-box protein [Acidimicrobiales bacterium]